MSRPTSPSVPPSAPSDAGAVPAVAGLSALATWLALTAWHGFVTYSSAFLLPAAALAVVLVLMANALEGRVARGVAVAAEAVVALLAVGWVSSGSPVPHRDVVGPIRDALHTASAYRSPVDSSHPSMTPLLFLGSAFALVAAVAVATHLRRVPTVALVALAIFAIPAGVHDHTSTLLPFVGAAGAFLGLVLVERRTLRAATAVPIGLGAVALAVVASTVVPVPASGMLRLGDSGDGALAITRPVADMRRDLTRGADQPLLDLTTSDPDPSYLRIAVLNRFTGEIWSSGDRSVRSDHRADGPVPLSSGLSPSVPRQAVDIRVRALPGFRSRWLPTAYPVSRVVADGDWRYDPVTMDFMAAGDTDTAGTSYSMTAQRLQYGTDGRWFHDAPDDAVPAEVTAVPGTVPTSVRDLTAEVVAGARTDYQRALLLQRFFRTTGHFRYSVKRAPEGAVGQTLATFLGRGGRVGYCEQFASAMAVMARISGIPARVAVGFLQPRRTGVDRWEYSSHDLHAWPELYFQGAGWVRFEPTPPSHASEAPGYTLVPVAGGHLRPPARHHPSAAPTSVGAEPSPTASRPQPEPKPHQVPSRRTTRVGAHGQGSGGVWRWVWGGLLVVLVGGLLACAPAVARRSLRSRRLDGGIEDAWAEVRATALDLRLAWPAGRSPRETAESLAQAAALGEPARTALSRLADDLGAARYSARPVPVATRAEPGVEAAEVVAAMESGTTSRRRRLARWLPISVLR